METLIVNLYGAPGAGKSSGAAYIFYRLKQLGINCEMVTEYAKDKVWEGHDEVFKDSIYIFGHQHFRISRLAGKVDVIITDSPLLIAAFYAPDEYKSEIRSLALKSFNKNQLNYFVKRVKKYNPKGRFQTEEESNKVSVDMDNFLREANVILTPINGDEPGYEHIINEIKEKISKS